MPPFSETEMVVRLLPTDAVLLAKAMGDPFIDMMLEKARQGRRQAGSAVSGRGNARVGKGGRASARKSARVA